LCWDSHGDYGASRWADALFITTPLSLASEVLVGTIEQLLLGFSRRDDNTMLAVD